jgi:plastocyanin
MDDLVAYGAHQVKAGTTVTWTSECYGPCTITFSTIPVNSGTMNRHDTFSHTFSEPGSFPYHCDFDPADMQGTIIVTQ